MSGRNIVRQMSEAIAPRGPDSSGEVVIAGGGPILAHRRLSILDTSNAGQQPMLSVSERFIIVYNGEIYNHLDLRGMLEIEGGPPSWRGHSDTETMLACFEAWGIDKTIARITGMFAFALWDEQERTLTLVRDRMGEKPLYYGIVNGTFLFGSEIKALQCHPEFRAAVDRNALTALVQRSYVPGPYTIYSGISKLQPGHMLTVNFNADGVLTSDLNSRPYWQLRDTVEQGLASPFIGSDDDAVSELRKLLVEVITSQMISDVPLGTFLSGGIDSSLVTAIMQEASSRPVRTFSIGFDDKQFDESESARAVADHIGSEHVELIVTPEHLMGLIPRLPEIYSEPFADSSQLPTFLVSQLAREHVTVALTGDGADEIFGGYNRYMATGKVWKYASRIPAPLRGMIGETLLSVPKSSWDGLFRALSPVLPRRFHARGPGGKFHKIGQLFKLKSRGEYYESLISLTPDPEALVIGGQVPVTAISQSGPWPGLNSFEQWMMLMDAETYLPDDICVKVDRASMANSLETRTPYLDRRIVEFAWRLPLDLKIRNGSSKWILREILAGYVPRALFERPKSGFGIPFGKWLRDPLYDWAEELLGEERLRAGGYFNPENIRKLWEAHLAGKGNHEYVLWNILMFQSWQEHWEH